ncbi:hypothetical protein Tco_0848624, partial [Tanacetum coccineum]
CIHQNLLGQANKDYYDKVFRDGNSGIDWAKCDEMSNDEKIEDKCVEKFVVDTLSVIEQHYNIDLKEERDSLFK